MNTKIEAGAGYRMLGMEEVIIPGDEFLGPDGWNPTKLGGIGMTVREANARGRLSIYYHRFYYRRLIEIDWRHREQILTSEIAQLRAGYAEPIEQARKLLAEGLSLSDSNYNLYTLADLAVKKIKELQSERDRAWSVCAELIGEKYNIRVQFKK